MGWEYYQGGPGAWGGWGILGMLLMVLFWGLLVFGIVASVRHYSAGRAAYHVPPVKANAALEELRLRYAKGEIDDEEFERRRANLEKGAPGA